MTLHDRKRGTLENVSAACNVNHETKPLTLTGVVCYDELTRLSRPFL
ncbi:hypothetical protein MY5147_001054 [Beauveria neobassiana]